MLGMVGQHRCSLSHQYARRLFVRAFAPRRGMSQVAMMARAACDVQQICTSATHQFSTTCGARDPVCVPPTFVKLYVAPTPPRPHLPPLPPCSTPSCGTPTPTASTSTAASVQYRYVLSPLSPPLPFPPGPMQLWDADPDCFQEGTRVRNALEYLRACQQLCAELGQLDFPFLVFHSGRDRWAGRKLRVFHSGRDR